MRKFNSKIIKIITFWLKWNDKKKQKKFWNLEILYTFQATYVCSTEKYFLDPKINKIRIIRWRRRFIIWNKKELYQIFDFIIKKIIRKTKTIFIALSKKKL